jgi:hypothetical protein
LLRQRGDRRGDGVADRIGATAGQGRAVVHPWLALAVTAYGTPVVLNVDVPTYVDMQSAGHRGRAGFGGSPRTDGAVTFALG